MAPKISVRGATPDKVAVGAATTDENGEFAADVTVAADCTPDTYVITMYEGPSVDAATKKASAKLVVTAPPTALPAAKPSATAAFA